MLGGGKMHPDRGKGDSRQQLKSEGDGARDTEPRRPLGPDGT